MLLRDKMKIKFEGRGEVLIQGLPRILNYGDVLDLPEDVAKKLLKTNSDFKLVEPVKKKRTYIEIPKEVKIEESEE